MLMLSWRILESSKHWKVLDLAVLLSMDSFSLSQSLLAVLDAKCKIEKFLIYKKYIQTVFN